MEQIEKLLTEHGIMPDAHSTGGADGEL